MVFQVQVEGAFLTTKARVLLDPMDFIISRASIWFCPPFGDLLLISLGIRVFLALFAPTLGIAYFIFSKFLDKEILPLICKPFCAWHYDTLFFLGIYIEY